MPTADELLVQMSRRGDIRAFNLLVRRWQKSVYNFALRFLGSHEEAQDVCQETFTKAYESLDGLRDASRFKHWLFTIAANLSRDRLKSPEHRRTVSLEELGGSESAETRSAGPERKLERAEAARLLKEALLKLPEPQRLALVLRTYHGLTTKEIAELTGESPGTVRSRIFHALRRMQSILAGMGLRREDLTDEMR